MVSEFAFHKFNALYPLRQGEGVGAVKKIRHSIVMRSLNTKSSENTPHGAAL
jgi:hypothetical protein